MGKIDDTNSTIRINDNAFEQTNGTDDQKAYMSKLYNFINNVKSGGEVAIDPYAQYAEECTNQCVINNDSYVVIGADGNEISSPTLSPGAEGADYNYETGE